MRPKNSDAAAAARRLSPLAIRAAFFAFVITRSGRTARIAARTRKTRATHVP